jgi:hypothetical protein
MRDGAAPGSPVRRRLWQVIGMQSDGETEGAWMLEITRTCIQCEGSGRFTPGPGQDADAAGQDADAAGSPAGDAACPACIHGKERRTVTLGELKTLLAMPASE